MAAIFLDVRETKIHTNFFPLPCNYTPYLLHKVVQVPALNCTMFHTLSKPIQRCRDLKKYDVRVADMTFIPSFTKE
jgi:hypothetical protein